MGLDLSDFPCASPEVVWACAQKSSKYIKGRITSVGADSHCHASSEVGNLNGLHLARDTGRRFLKTYQIFSDVFSLGLRHVVAFDLELGDEEGTIRVTEFEPHSHTPVSARTHHTVPYTSAKTCYEDILKVGCR